MSDLPASTEMQEKARKSAALKEALTRSDVRVAWAKIWNHTESQSAEPQPGEAHGFAEAVRRIATGNAPSPSLEAERKEMLAALDRDLPDLQRQMDVLQTASASDENAGRALEELQKRMHENRRLRRDVANAHSSGEIKLLKTDVSQASQATSAAVSKAEGTVAAVASGMASSMGNAAIALEQARRETTSFLERTAADYEKRTDFATNLAAKYGIDVSAERKAIDEAKRREAEAKTPEEKLDWRIRGYRAEIELHDKNLDNPHLTDKERQREEEAKRKALKELEEAEQRRARMKAAQKGTEQSTEHTTDGFNQRQQDSYAAHRRDVSRQRYQHLLTDAESIRAEAEYITQKSEWRKTNTLNAAADAARPIIEASRAVAEEGKRADAKKEASFTEVASFGQETETKAADQGTDKAVAPTRMAVADEKDGHQAVAAPPTTPAATKPVAEAPSTPKGRSV